MDETACTTNEERRLVAIDFETAWPWDHIIEIGCVEMRGTAKTGRVFWRLVKPRVPNRMSTFGIHGIRGAELAGERTFKELADEFLDFLGDSPIVAHFAAYERVTLQRELERIGRPPLDPERYICTLKMARATGRFRRNNLGTVARRLKMYKASHREGCHDALTDAHMAADIYFRLHRESSTKIKLTDASVTLTNREIGAYHDICESRSLAKLRAENRAQTRFRSDRLRELLYKKGDVDAYINLLMEGYD